MNVDDYQMHLQNKSALGNVLGGCLGWLLFIPAVAALAAFFALFLGAVLWLIVNLIKTGGVTDPTFSYQASWAISFGVLLLWEIFAQAIRN